MMWGLVPHWSKHLDKNLNTINARSENIVNGGGMWASVKKNRCAVLSQGYIYTGHSVFFNDVYVTPATMNG
jgi:putative SOS response-associated peptidase YedK